MSMRSNDASKAKVEAAVYLKKRACCAELAPSRNEIAGEERMPVGVRRKIPAREGQRIITPAFPN